MLTTGLYEIKGKDSLELHVWHANVSARKFYESLGLQTVQHKMRINLRDEKNDDLK